MNVGHSTFPLAHLAIAVKEISSASGVYQALGFTLAEPEIVAAQHVRAQLATKGDLHIELLEPCPAGTGPIAKFIEKRGPGLHHVALRSTDLQADLAALENSGIKLLPGFPADGLGGTRVAFLDPKTTGGALIELVGAKTR
ncbi:MAG TPA: VOC family protein [Planctomycetota bacterium]|jgi:methylmalonyl-CoA epimerase